MKKKYLIKALRLLVISALIFQSCTDDNVENEDNYLKGEEISLEMTPSLEKILDMGFSLENIVEEKNSYIVEGDLLFPKDLSFYKNLESSVSQYNLIDCRYGPSLVSTTDSFGNNNPRIIRIHSELDPQGQINELPVWNSALNYAISELNSISSSSCLIFVNSVSPFGADIRIVNDPTLTSGGYAVAGMQSGDDPFPLIRINKDRSDVFTTARSRNNTVLHEIIHCLGFNEHQGINSIMYPDPAGLPFDGLTIIDVNDFNCAYSNCGSTPNAIITGPSEFCVNASSITYTLNNTSLSAASWTISPLSSIQQNLTIETPSSLTITPINSGESSTITITATLSDGSTTNPLNVDIIGRPTPNPLVGVSGPSILQYYQSGLFYTNGNSFDNHNDVEWVVYSYNFPSAMQYFNVQSPSGNNEFNALIEVLPTAPPGNYVVQCRVSNNCGTYYLEKSLEVKSGPPQIFNF